MRVLLVWPRNDRAVLSDELSCCEPLPLEYLAGALRPNHDVWIHDLRLDPPLDALAESIEAPDVVGLAIPYTTAVACARQTSLDIKRLWPRTRLIIGGHHPTVSREWLDGFAADYVIAGEGGGLLKHVVERIEQSLPVEAMPGVAELHQFRAAPLRPKPTTLAEIPPPDRDLLRRHRQSYFHSIYRPVALVRFTAGCPYQCNFCSLWMMTDRRYLTKEIPRVIDELSDIDVDNVYVVDDEAFIQPQRMTDLAKAIESTRIRKRYHMYVRTDTALRRADVMERWARIGLDSVLVGAESMTESELAGYEKGTTPDQTRSAMRLFHDLGVKVRANFIVKPSWEEDDFFRLAATIDELGVDMPSFSVLTPLPGTLLYQSERDQLITDDPELFDCYHALIPTRLPLERFYGLLAGLLETTANRPSHGPSLGSGAPIFYFSDSEAFARMVAKVRSGATFPQRTDAGRSLVSEEATA